MTDKKHEGFEYSFYPDNPYDYPLDSPLMRRQDLEKFYNPKTGLYEIPVRVERPDDWRNSERTNI